MASITRGAGSLLDGSTLATGNYRAPAKKSGHLLIGEPLPNPDANAGRGMLLEILKRTNVEFIRS
jgi:hypothetical protein